MQQTIEVERQKMELTRRRAIDLTTSQIKSETLVKETEGDVASKRLNADVILYEQQNANAERILVDVSLYKILKMLRVKRLLQMLNYIEINYKHKVS